MRKRDLLGIAIALISLTCMGCGPLFVIKAADTTTAPVGGKPSAQPPRLSRPETSVVDVDSQGALTITSTVQVRDKLNITSVGFEVIDPTGDSFTVVAVLSGRDTYSATYPIPRGGGGTYYIVAVATNSEGKSAQIDMPEPVILPPAPPDSLL